MQLNPNMMSWSVKSDQRAPLGAMTTITVTMKLFQISVIAVESEVSNYLANPDRSLAMLNKYPMMNAVFTEFNTTLPIQPRIECLFRVGWTSRDVQKKPALRSNFKKCCSERPINGLKSDIFYLLNCISFNDWKQFDVDCIGLLGICFRHISHMLIIWTEQCSD